MKIRKGDTVKVITGKDRGKQGKVMRVLPKEKKIVVEGVNVMKKHKKKTGNEKDPGGIIDVTKPIDVSNVMLVCKSCNKPTRVGYKMDNGRKQRVCRKCGKSVET